MIYYSRGSERDILSNEEIRDGLYSAFGSMGMVRRILIIPPDFTRKHSRAGWITSETYGYFRNRIKDVLPALGTHAPMSEHQITEMFPGVPLHLFRVHDWRNDIHTLGRIPSSDLSRISSGSVSYHWDIQVNNLLVNGGHDLILSIGQVVPHEVAGMANHNKNIFVGTGGPESIHKSHYLGAACDMEVIMGRIHNPVRSLLNMAESNVSGQLPRIVYILTVIARNKNNQYVVKGLFIGDDFECFEKAAILSQKVNFEIVEKPLNNVLVYLDPDEFKSTWLGNKAIYRTRMALADQADLKILAPGIKAFGEDPEIDRLIRKYGYSGINKMVSAVETERELSDNLAAAAHLIHGSSEGRFHITYGPGHLTREEIEKVGFGFENPEVMIKKYNPRNLKDGFNTIRGGEEVYFISNPALGLWTIKEKLNA